jgi:outer membrane immunogenic protein
MRKLTLSLLTFTALTGAAAAADLPAAKAPVVVVAPIYNWTGVYGGVDLGGAFGQTSVYLPASATNVNIGNNGVFGGAQFGYNYQINSLVFGVEAEFNLQSVKGSQNFQIPPSANVYGAKSQQDWFASIDGRLGYAFNRYLVYAVGGYAFSQFNSSLTTNALQVAGVSTTFNGYNVGAGVEYAFTDHWAGRAEYRYYNYGSNNAYYNAWPKNFSQKLESNTVRIGLSYKFGADEPVAVVAKN